jgi:hypothetical protein
MVPARKSIASTCRRHPRVPVHRLVSARSSPTCPALHPAAAASPATPPVATFSPAMLTATLRASPLRVGLRRALSKKWEKILGRRQCCIILVCNFQETMSYFWLGKMTNRDFVVGEQ